MVEIIFGGGIYVLMLPMTFSDPHVRTSSDLGELEIVREGGDHWVSGPFAGSSCEPRPGQKAEAACLCAQIPPLTCVPHSRKLLTCKTYSKSLPLSISMQKPFLLTVGLVVILNFSKSPGTIVSSLSLFSVIIFIIETIY